MAAEAWPRARWTALTLAKVSPFRSRRDQPPLHDLRDRLHQWVRANVQDLYGAVPDMPVEDRAADTWEPLFAIAELAGGEWPTRARRACLALTGEDPDDGRIGTKLLADLKEIWDESEDHLFTTTIIERLCTIEESPWSEWGPDRNKKISPRQLAGLLKPYRVKSKTVREPGAGTAMGYARSELVDPWDRCVGTSSNTANTPTQDDEKANPTRDDARVGSVLDDVSRSNTGADQGDQADCVAVLDVSEQVPEVDELPFVERCAACGERLDEPGLLKRCLDRHTRTAA